MTRTSNENDFHGSLTMRLNLISELTVFIYGGAAAELLPSLLALISLICARVLLSHHDARGLLCICILWSLASRPSPGEPARPQESSCPDLLSALRLLFGVFRLSRLSKSCTANQVSSRAAFRRVWRRAAGRESRGVVILTAAVDAALTRIARDSD